MLFLTVINYDSLIMTEYRKIKFVVREKRQNKIDPRKKNFRKKAEIFWSAIGESRSRSMQANKFQGIKRQNIKFELKI
jgi:hypothetical protein